MAWSIPWSMRGRSRMMRNLSGSAKPHGLTGGGEPYPCLAFDEADRLDSRPFLPSPCQPAIRGHMICGRVWCFRLNGDRCHQRTTSMAKYKTGSCADVSPRTRCHQAWTRHTNWVWRTTLIAVNRLASNNRFCSSFTSGRGVYTTCTEALEFIFIT